MRVVIAGSSGLIGSWLAPDLESRGVEVLRLVRRPSAVVSDSEAHWDPATGRLDPTVLDGSDAVVNLAGHNIGNSRWTARTKRLLLSSRLDSTATLVRALTRCETPPRLLINASAVGYYGDRGDELLDESSPAGCGFLPELAAAWEHEAEAAAAAGVRIVLLRLGMVVARGGALARMLPAFRVGLGGPLGSGRQWWPWVAMEDALGVVAHALDTADLSGPVNVVSPQQVRCREFVRTLGRVLRRPALLPAPSPLLRLLLGEMADGLLLASARTTPTTLEASGYTFLVPTLAEAFRRAID